MAMLNNQMVIIFWAHVEELIVYADGINIHSWLVCDT